MLQESLLRQLFLQSEILPLHSQLLHLLDLQLVREELSVKIIVLCLKFILFFCCFNNGFVKSCLSRAASPISVLGSIWCPEYRSFLLYPFRQFRQASTRAIGCTRYVKSCLSRVQRLQYQDGAVSGILGIQFSSVSFQIVQTGWYERNWSSSRN